MSLIKRGTTWWIIYTTPSGQRIRCSARTEDKKAAQELHDKLKAESWRVEQIGEKPKRSWDEAALKWLQETSHKKTHLMDVDIPCGGYSSSLAVRILKVDTIKGRMDLGFVSFISE